MCPPRGVLHLAGRLVEFVAVDDVEGIGAVAEGELLGRHGVHFLLLDGADAEELREDVRREGVAVAGARLRVGEDRAALPHPVDHLLLDVEGDVGGVHEDDGAAGTVAGALGLAAAEVALEDPAHGGMEGDVAQRAGVQAHFAADAPVVVDGHGARLVPADGADGAHLET